MSSRRQIQAKSRLDDELRKQKDEEVLLANAKRHQLKMVQRWQVNHAEKAANEEREFERNKRAAAHERTRARAFELATEQTNATFQAQIANEAREQLVLRDKEARLAAEEAKAARDKEARARFAEAAAERERQKAEKKAADKAAYSAIQARLAMEREANEAKRRAALKMQAAAAATAHAANSSAQDEAVAKVQKDEAALKALTAVTSELREAKANDLVKIEEEEKRRRASRQREDMEAHWQRTQTSLKAEQVASRKAKAALKANLDAQLARESEYAAGRARRAEKERRSLMEKEEAGRRLRDEAHAKLLAERKSQQMGDLVKRGRWLEHEKKEAAEKLREGRERWRCEKAERLAQTKAEQEAAKERSREFHEAARTRAAEDLNFELKVKMEREEWAAQEAIRDAERERRRLEQAQERLRQTE